MGCGPQRFAGRLSVQYQNKTSNPTNGTTLRRTHSGCDRYRAYGGPRRESGQQCNEHAAELADERPQVRLAEERAGDSDDNVCVDDEEHSEETE